MFFRNVPDNGGFAIMAGLEQIVERIENMRFDESDIEFFRSKGTFGEKFLDIGDQLLEFLLAHRFRILCKIHLLRCNLLRDCDQIAHRLLDRRRRNQPACVRSS